MIVLIIALVYWDKHHWGTKSEYALVLWTMICLWLWKGLKKLTEVPRGQMALHSIDLLGLEYIVHKLCPKPLFGYVFRCRNNLWVVYWIFVPNTIFPFHPSWGKLFEFHEAQPCWPMKGTPSISYLPSSTWHDYPAFKKVLKFLLVMVCLQDYIWMLPLPIIE